MYSNIIRKSFYLAAAISVFAQAKTYTLNSLLSQKLMNQLNSGGLVATDITNQNDANEIQAIKFDAGNTVCFTSRFLSTDTGEATDNFEGLVNTHGCSVKAPNNPVIEQDLFPSGTHISTDLEDFFSILKEGVYGDAAMGKWIDGVANLTCIARMTKAGENYKRTYSCTYTDWPESK